MARPLARSQCAALLTLTALLMTGCGEPHSGVREGKALVFEGAMAEGVLAPGSVRSGEVLGYAFPEIRNQSDHPVKLMSFKILGVPRGVKVVKYRFLSSRDTGGFLLGSFPADADNAEGYDYYKGYSNPIVPPKSKTFYYGVVYLKVLEQDASDVTKCQVRYQLEARPYIQDVPCDFRPRPVKPPAG